MMWQGLSLLFVGAVLCLNGLWQLKRISDQEIEVINFLVGALSLLVALRTGFWADASADDVRNAALTLLFSFTYFWVGWNQRSGADGRGLGWFSLFVAVTAAATAAQASVHASTAWEIWNAFNWWAWSGLWALFFMALGLQKPMPRLIGCVLILEGIFTAWLPGYLLLSGAIHP